MTLFILLTFIYLKVNKMKYINDKIIELLQSELDLSYNHFKIVDNSISSMMEDNLVSEMENTRADHLVFMSALLKNIIDGGIEIEYTNNPNSDIRVSLDRLPKERHAFT